MVVLAIAATGLVWGCGDQESIPAETLANAPQRGGVLRMPLEVPTSLDPALTDDAYEATVTNQVFSGLVQWDDDLNVLPDIAQSWTISRDGLQYEFELRANARFHNGRTVTAEDFVYTFTRLLDTRRIEPSIIQDYLVRIDGAEEYMAGEVDVVRGLSASGPLALTVRLSRPYPSFLSVLCMDQARVVPAEEVERTDRDFGRYPVGSGPFRLGFWNPDSALILTMFADYFGAPAYLDTLVFVHYLDNPTERGKVDFLAGRLEARLVREAEIGQLMRQGDYFVIRRPELSVELLGLNSQSPPLDDPRVRRAVAMAVDREALRVAAGRGSQAPVGLLPPGMPGYSPESKIWAENLTEARRLLAEVGYGPENPLRFSILSASVTDHAVARDRALLSGLKRVSIVPEIRYVSWNELDQHLTDKSAPAFLISWIADLPDPDSFVYTLCETNGYYNIVSYSNPGVDSLLAAGRYELDISRRVYLYRQAERLILEDAPLIPLFNTMTIYAFQPQVRGVEMAPIGLSSIPMEKIWLDRPAAEALHAGF